MIKEYRVSLKGSSQGNYIIADNPNQAIRYAIARKSWYSKYRITDFKVMLWKRGKTIYTLKRVDAKIRKVNY